MAPGFLPECVGLSEVSWVSMALRMHLVTSFMICSCLRQTSLLSLPFLYLHLKPKHKNPKDKKTKTKKKQKKKDMARLYMVSDRAGSAWDYASEHLLGLGVGPGASPLLVDARIESSFLISRMRATGSSGVPRYLSKSLAQASHA